MITVGALETEAFHQQSRAYAERSPARSSPASWSSSPDLDHFAIVMAMTDAGQSGGARDLCLQLGLPGAAA